MFLAWFIPVIVVFIVLFFVIAIKVGKKQNTTLANKAGEESELKVNDQIQKLIDNKLNHVGSIYQQFIFYCDRKKEASSEIDLLVVTHAGIFVIEIKGWKGTITCNSNDKEWEHTNHGKIVMHRNPIWQNENHIKNFLRVWRKFDNKIPKIFSMVIFSEQETIPCDGVYTTSLAVNDIYEKSINGKENIAKINNVILKILNTCSCSKKEHMKFIKSMTKKHNQN